MSQPVDSQLRERLQALSDLELARMLRIEADNYRIDALLLAKEEARRRTLDLDRLEDELRGIASSARATPEAETAEQTSLEQTAPLDTRQMASLWPWALVVSLGVAIEVWIVTQEKLNTNTARMALLAGSLLGFGFYLYAVQRLHALLRESTGGRYPISPGKAVGMHFVPILGFFWPFTWGGQLSRFAERNGRGREIDRYVPGVLFLAAYLSGYWDGVLRLLLLFATVAYTQLRLARSMRHAQLSEAPSGDWSSSTKT